MDLPSHTWKAVATAFGVSLAGVEVVLNASFTANGGSLTQPMVIASVIITAAGASALPIAMRAWSTGSRGLAMLLGGMFLPLALAISFTSALERSGDRRDTELAAHRASNRQESLAQQTYADALRTKNRECTDRKDGSPICRSSERALAAAATKLDGRITTTAQKVEDGMAHRLATVLFFMGVNEEGVQLYVPLLTPAALLLGGFLFLAIGLSPAPETPVTGDPGGLPERCPVLPPPATMSRLRSKTEVLESLKSRVMQAGERGYPFRSRRALAKELNAAPASFNNWLTEWERNAFVINESGKEFVLKLKSLRGVA